MQTSFLSFLFRNRRFFIGLFILAVGVIMLDMLPQGQMIQHWFQRKRNFGWNVFWINYSFMGDAFFAVGLIIYLFVFRKQAKLAGLILLSFVFTMLCLQSIHWLLHTTEEFSLHSESTQYIQTDYYFGTHTPEASGWLPSHHLAVFLSWVTVWGCYTRLRVGQYGIVLAIAVMGFSRVYLYPGQDLVGLLLGGAIGFLVGASVVFTGHYRMYAARSWKWADKFSLPPARLKPDSGFWNPAG